jgi:hypothetical protein
MAPVLKRVCIFTRNLEVSLKFWGEMGLGFRTLVASYDNALLESNGVGVHIRQTYDEALLSVGYAPLLQFDVKDGLSDMVPRLLQTGATMDGGIVYQPEATIVSLRSPCGVMVTLVEPTEGFASAEPPMR